MHNFSSFTKQLPSDIQKSVKVFWGDNLAIFKPQTFISDINFFDDDHYHYIITSTITPPTLFNGKEYEFSRGRLIAVNPGTQVLCKNSVATKEYMSIAVKKTFLSEVAQEMGFGRDVTFVKADNPCPNQLRYAAACFESEIVSYGNQCSLMLDSISIQIAVVLLRSLDSNMNGISNRNPSCNCYIKNAIEYIHAYYSSNLTVKDICRAIHITPYHFIRTFKEETGMTPHDFLQEVRVENAKAFIKKNELTISQISQMCGFVSPAHFSTTFKRMTGTSPIEFKKKG